MGNMPIRIGKISSVDKKTGMVSVLYEDRENEVTGMLPYFNYGDEYKPPKIGQMVLVAHISNGNVRAVVIGSYYNEANPPKVPEADWYKSIFGTEAFMRYDEATKTLRIKAENIVLETADNNVRVNDLYIR